MKGLLPILERTVKMDKHTARHRRGGRGRLAGDVGGTWLPTSGPIASRCGNSHGDLLEAGIIDPTKVTRTALQNAASIAGLMITTECLVADKPEEEKKMPGGMGGMGGGDMY